MHNICVHKYLTVCKTNPQPPGLGDFVRGTIAMFNFSQKYNFTLFVDKTHPIFSYLEDNEYLVKTEAEIIELLPPFSYDTIYNNLEQLFVKGDNFSVMTNSFYTIENRRLKNFGPITNECRFFLRKVFTPTLDVKEKVDHVLGIIYGINENETFKIVHLRFGDAFLHDSNFENDSMFQKNNFLIQKLIDENPDQKLVLMSDSSRIASKLKKCNPTLCYWENAKIHLGDLKSNASNSIFETMVDFFIMSNAVEIMTTGDGSGFSKAVSEIFEIKYTLI